ncbi:MAG: hypothetical protein CO140_03275 [Candidatus Moranbacteria bacterium CG_4_9_14_3_um_filter_40_7]|nr:MAG: hypothetical protein COX31_01895 [Candidatus Moranbacteria bacterium CG23_combo_of_CG06-09_8_20_14_all_40_16]PJA87628.1 MAG: hypothetical protein CO140_03275 [Candidatus Moranbacteria bacterium CG_4_9_14_3_um_filter_40_7]
MKYFKFNHIVIILFLIFSGIILWQFFNFLSFADSALNFKGDNKQEKFYPNSPLIQKITAAENNFNQVNVSLSKFSPQLGDKIILEVADESCEKIMAESKRDMFSWRSPGYEKFRFPAIADSQDKTYCLKFTHVLGKFKPAKKPYISAYPAEGSSYINTGKSMEEQKNRSLKLKPAYGRDSYRQNFSQLIDRMSQYKPDYLKSEFLITLFGLSLALIFFVSILIIFL